MWMCGEGVCGVGREECGEFGVRFKAAFWCIGSETARRMWMAVCRAAWCIPTFLDFSITGELEFSGQESNDGVSTTNLLSVHLENRYLSTFNLVGAKERFEINIIITCPILIFNFPAV